MRLFFHSWTIRDSRVAVIVLATALLLAQMAYRSIRTAAFPLDTPPVLLPLDDFHEVEHFSEQEGIYRWTQRNSSVELPNPGGVAIIQFTLASGAERIVPISVHIGDASLPFLVGPDFRTYSLLQPMPPGERVKVTLDLSDSAVIQVGGRTLGVMVSQIQIVGGGAVPAYVLLALTLATLSGYILLRQCAHSPLSSASIIAAAQGMVLLWQRIGGWHYALFVPLLTLITAAILGAVLWESRRQQAEDSNGLLPSPPPVLDRPTPRFLPRLSLSWTVSWLPGRSIGLCPLPRFSQQWIAALLLLGLALVVRLPWLAAPDPVGDLELAARRMGFLYSEGLAGAYRADGDYLPLRLYLLQALSQPVPLLDGSFSAPLSPLPILLIKLPGLLADLATVAILYRWSLRWCPPRQAVALAALYACAPPVWINVAWWGQVDTLLILPLVGMVVLLDYAGGRWSWLCWTIALLIKPQAVVFAPLLYIATLRLHGGRGIVQGGALSIGLFVLACLPLVLKGQGPGLMQAYLGSVGRFPRLTAGAYNLWYLVTQGSSTHDTGQGIGGVSYRHIGLFLVGSIALLIGAMLLRRADGPARAEAAAILALAFFCLPTQIHERYLFLALPFLALRIASDVRLLLPFLLLMVSATLNILGTLSGFAPMVTPLIAQSPLPSMLAIVNLGILLFLMGHMLHTQAESGAR